MARIEEVQLRVVVMLETTARESLVGDDDTSVTEQVADKLVALGARWLAPFDG